MKHRVIDFNRTNFYDEIGACLNYPRLVMAYIINYLHTDTCILKVRQGHYLIVCSIFYTKQMPKSLSTGYYLSMKVIFDLIMHFIKKILLLNKYKS